MSIKARIKIWLQRRLGVPQIEFALERLAQRGFRPSLIFDVGAYQGDFARICRSIWPEAEIACFEPQSEALQRLERSFSGDQRLRAWPYLLGETAKEKEALHLAETASSVLEEQVHQDLPVAHFPMRTVDDTVQREYAGRVPEVLKLDVQGYELQILRGAENSLNKVLVILMEVNLIDIHEGVPLLADVIEWLGTRNWVAYDICGLTRRPLDRALWQADMIFIPKDGALRSDKRYR